MSEKISSFRQLFAWQESHKLVLMIYEITKVFPKNEIFGLTNQLRRAAVSISSNIAEGFSRQYFKEKIQFYFLSQGSNTEVQNQLLIAKDVGYLEAGDFKRIADQSAAVGKLLSGLIKKTRVLVNSGSSF